MPDGGLVAVHAHPDDETLATGALLATWAAAGERVTVVTCTRGERGEVIDTPEHPTGVGHLEGDGPALAAHREDELAHALTALGVHDHVFLDAVARGTGPTADGETEASSHGAPPARYTDSGMAWAAPGIARAAAEAQLPAGAFVAVPLDEAASRLVTVLRERRPAVVVTYEAGGGYGHPDHVRAHEVTVRALELLASSGDAVPSLWQVVAPESAVRAARRALADRPAVQPLLTGPGRVTLPDPDETLPPLAVPDARLGDASPLVAVPVAPVLTAVLAAMRAHATQVRLASASDAGPFGPTPEPLVGWYALSNDVLAPVPSHEFYAPSRAALRTLPEPGADDR
ncbi:PIG-L family deacetylase [Cellulosimicrobium sp. NPDC057127]|uniref:PIG-L family deacetylase n=1 Tax=Cellulosimicrobium sp. NPDC057127 TaxID=3346026 RepID=UPI00362A750A